MKTDFVRADAAPPLIYVSDEASKSGAGGRGMELYPAVAAAVASVAREAYEHDFENDRAAPHTPEELARSISARVARSTGLKPRTSFQQIALIELRYPREEAAAGSGMEDEGEVIFRTEIGSAVEAGCEAVWEAGGSFYAQAAEEPVAPPPSLPPSPFSRKRFAASLFALAWVLTDLGFTIKGLPAGRPARLEVTMAILGFAAGISTWAVWANCPGAPAPAGRGR